MGLTRSGFNRPTTKPPQPRYCCACGDVASAACDDWDHAVYGLDDIPGLLDEADKAAVEAGNLRRERDELRQKLDSMATSLATIVRWGMGPNLQSTSGRATLERAGYTLDADGWMEGEPGYLKARRR